MKALGEQSKRNENAFSDNDQSEKDILGEFHKVIFFIGLFVYLSGILSYYHIFELSLLHITSIIFLIFTPIIIYISSDQRKGFLPWIKSAYLLDYKNGWKLIESVTLLLLTINGMASFISGMIMFNGLKNQLTTEIHFFGLYSYPIFMSILFICRIFINKGRNKG